MPFNWNGGSNFNGVNFVNSAAGINASLKKVILGSNGSTVWQKATQQSVNVANYYIGDSDNHIGTDRKSLLYGPIDASLYKSLTINVLKTEAVQNWSTYMFSVGIGSGTDPVASNLDNMTATVAIGTAYTDYYGNVDEHYDHSTRSITIEFAETSGNVYVFFGVVAGNGHGSYYMEFEQTATINPR